MKVGRGGQASSGQADASGMGAAVALLSRPHSLLTYRQFVALADLHRRLVGQVDQKVGREKAIIRKYVAAIDRRLAAHPNSREFFAQWRKESGMGG